MTHLKRSNARFPLGASHDSRSRRRLRVRVTAPESRGPKQDKRQRGVALIIAVTSIAILSVLLADMHESTGTAHAIATTQRDQLKAEYLAKSGINLTRLLVGQEPRIRQIVAPMYQMLLGRPPPQLPVWTLANDLLRPFCDYESSEGGAIDFGSAEGLGDLGGTCEIISFAENSKINVNLPLLLSAEDGKRSVAMQLFALTGGYQSPSPYDPIFSNRDADGQFTSRLDLVSAVVDWWDFDTNRTQFDPGRTEVTSAGGEDDVSRSYDDPYSVKNAPFDSLQELRLIRGVGEDFWSTFVEPSAEDPNARVMTIYGSGRVNPNEAPPEVLLARLCSFIEDQPLCVNPLEAAKFIQLLSTVRSMIPVPFFTRPTDFLNFIEGRGGSRDLYPMLRGFLGEDSQLLFTPASLTPQQRTEIARLFVTGAKILTVHSTGRVGRARVRINSVMNFHERWNPPPPNAGGMPALGVFHYYRVD